MPITPDISQITPANTHIAPDINGGNAAGGTSTQVPAPGQLLPQQSATLANGDPDLSTVPGLLAEANQTGGMVAEQANALAHPNTGFLSTVSDKFKNAFPTFMTALNAPGALVAAGLSGTNPAEAIAKNLKPDQVLFGADSSATTMQKAGDFLVRTATDVALDPLTYFGDPIGGLLGKSTIPLLGDAAKMVGVDEGMKVALNSGGQKYYGALKTAENFYKDNIIQMGKQEALGTAMANFMRTGDEKFAQGGAELQELLKQTLDIDPGSALGKDYTTRALSNLFAKFPEMTQTYLDKGGIKILGQSIIDGATIRNAIKLIPGMTTLDHFTAPMRGMVTALFDTSLVRDETNPKGWTRLPQEYLDMKNMNKTNLQSFQQSKYESLYALARAHGLSTDQAYMVRDAMENRAIPADPKLAKAYLDGLGISPDQLKIMRDNGFPVTDLNGHVMAHVREMPQIPVKPLPFKTTAPAETGATKFASLGKFIKQNGTGFESITGEAVSTSGEQVLEKLPNEITALKDIPNGTGLIGKIAGAGSTQEAGFAVGDHIADRLRQLTSGETPMSFEQAFETPEIKQLIDTQSAMQKLTPAQKLIGSPEDFGLKALDNVGQAYMDSSGSTYKRMQATIQELHDSGFDGFDPNYYTAALARYYDIGKAVTMKHFYSDVATQFGRKASEAPQGWRAVTSKGLSKATSDIFQNNMMQDGEEMYFHPAIAKDIEKFTGSVINDDATNELMKTYDKIQGAWKASVTSVFPAFHGRNALTHVINNFLDLGVAAFNPSTHIMAGQFVKNDMAYGGMLEKSLGIGDEAMKAKDDIGKLLNTKMFTDNAGHEWTFGQIRQMVKDNGIAFGHGGPGGPEDIYLSNKELAEKMQGVSGGKKAQIDKLNPFNQNFIPYAQGRHVGNALVNQARMVNFISNLRNTGDIQLATARTKQFLFDYGALTNFEKTFARRLIPFYTFTRKNLELQVHTLMTQPGRIAAELTSAQNLGDVISGQNQLNDQEKKALPEWIRNGMFSVTSKQGENVSIRKGFQVPAMQPFEALTPNALLGSIAPAIRVPVEQATGYSFFQGKPLSQITNATAFQNAPKAIKNFIGFYQAQGVDSQGKAITYYVSLKPSNMNLLLNLPPTTRVFSSIKQMDTADQTTSGRILQQLLGVNTYNFNLTTEARRQQNETKAQLQALLNSAHVTAPDNQVYIPKNQQPIGGATPQKKSGISGLPVGAIAQGADLIF